jgi:hypothetical protein
MVAITWAGFVAMLRGTFKSIFGDGNGENQIGSRNQAARTSGGNSPVTVAGRDVNLHVTAARAHDHEAGIFKHLEKTMPDFLQGLRDGLADRPLVRYILTPLPEGFGTAYAQPHLKMSQELNPDIITFLEILGDYGLVEEKDSRFIYRLNERLVAYLTKSAEDLCDLWGPTTFGVIQKTADLACPPLGISEDRATPRDISDSRPNKTPVP